MKGINIKISFLLMVVITLAGCKTQSRTPVSQLEVMNAGSSAQVEYTLSTGMADGKMVYTGVGGEIEGRLNPDLSARNGDTVRIVVINGDGIPHDLAIPDLNAQSSMLGSKGQATEIVFSVENSGVYPYYCTVAGHRQAGMEGTLVVESVSK